MPEAIRYERPAVSQRMGAARLTGRQPFPLLQDEPTELARRLRSLASSDKSCMCTNEWPLATKGPLHGKPLCQCHRCAQSVLGRIDYRGKVPAVGSAPFRHDLKLAGHLEPGLWRTAIAFRFHGPPQSKVGESIIPIGTTNELILMSVSMLFVT